MPSARPLALLLLASLGAGCAPLAVAPLAGPQGATFFAEPRQDLPLLREPLPLLDETAPSPLRGNALCGGDAGEQARAQCLRGEGWDWAPRPD